MWATPIVVALLAFVYGSLSKTIVVNKKYILKNKFIYCLL